MQRDDPVPADEEMPPNVTPISSMRMKARRPQSERTELDVSAMFVNRFGQDLRYCADRGGWFVWAGTHWKRDVCERAREYAKEIAQAIAYEAAALRDLNTFKVATRVGSARGVAAVLDLARSAPEIVVSPDAFDRDPWALNVANGTLDLRVGELRPHRREDLITRVCSTEYDPKATAPTFERFLAEVQPEPEVRAYLARLFGYAATGVTKEHVLGVFLGPGANGKSVLADAVTNVLGEYAKPGPSSLIVDEKSHPTDVASLVGSRLVVVHETKRGAAFETSKVKLLTGGDQLTARHMREDFFQFSPSHTLIMLSNYRPKADATDAALWRRIHLVPFEVVIPIERRDPNLAEVIRVEAGGVLRWVVEGTRDWLLNGLSPPARIREQTECYRASEDTIGQFLEECTVRLAQASVKAGPLYEAFRKWCEASGQRPSNSKDFSEQVIRHGFERVGRNTGRLYIGLGLKAEALDQDGEWSQ